MNKEPHAITRARERFGIELTKADIVEIGRMVADGRAILVRDHGKECSRQWLVRIRDCAMIACVSRIVGTVLTILPPPGVKRTARVGGEQAKKDHRELRRKRDKGWRTGSRGKRMNNRRPQGGNHGE